MQFTLRTSWLMWIHVPFLKVGMIAPPPYQTPHHQEKPSCWLHYQKVDTGSSSMHTSRELHYRWVDIQAIVPHPPTHVGGEEETPSPTFSNCHSSDNWQRTDICPRFTRWGERWRHLSSLDKLGRRKCSFVCVKSDSTPLKNTALPKATVPTVLDTFLKQNHRQPTSSPPKSKRYGQITFTGKLRRWNAVPRRMQWCTVPEKFITTRPNYSCTDINPFNPLMATNL